MVKSDARRWNAMVLDIRGHVLVVWKSLGQRRIVRMWLRIIPVQSLPTLAHGVTIALDHTTRKIQVLPDRQRNLVREFNSAGEFCDARPMPYDDQSGTLDRRIAFR